MNFDTVIERRGTHSMKWDMMEHFYGVAPEGGLAMWVADMDFRPPAVALEALAGLLEHGVFGYYGRDQSYRESIRWWMKTRHGWEIQPEWIFSAHGLVNGTALCVDAYTEPGDGVVLFSPVYHAFARILKAADRPITELPLANVDGRYEMDFASYGTRMSGKEKMAILCSPHNPGGRVWTPEELRGLARFCEKHGLILVSDEIHHDLVMPGHRHTAFPLAAPDYSQQTVVLTAPSKTFNLAGAHTGNVIIPDAQLRARFESRIAALGISPNSFGLHLAEAVYSEQGAEWVDALVRYLDENRRLFDDGMHAISGVRSMKMESTYLAWVDFSDTGISRDEFTGRVEKVARIAANRGPTFGLGGENFLRFNFAMPRSQVEEAVDRIQNAFKSAI